MRRFKLTRKIALARKVEQQPLVADREGQPVRQLPEPLEAEIALAGYCPSCLADERQPKWTRLYRVPETFCCDAGRKCPACGEFFLGSRLTLPAPAAYPVLPCFREEN